MFQAVSWFRERRKWAVLGVVVTTVVTNFAQTQPAPPKSLPPTALSRLPSSAIFVGWLYTFSIRP
jgi:hypothetical protein